MSVTTLPAFLDALATALGARAGLSGVKVFTAPVDPGELGKEAIELGDEVDIEQERASMSSTVLEESYPVPGSIMCFAPIKTTSNAAAKTARDRCATILEELTDELSTNDDMTNTVRDCRIATQKWRQGMAPEGQLGRVCWVQFTIEVEAQVTP